MNENRNIERDKKDETATLSMVYGTENPWLE